MRRLTRIRKPCGESENFDRNRLVQSIRSAGVTERTAASVVDQIRLSEDISTEELTLLVVEQLRRINPVLSEIYVATENLKVRAAQDVSVGVAKMPEDLLKRFRMAPGQRVDVTHLNSKTEMAVEPAKGVDPREILLNRTDVYRLGAHEGAKVVVTFPH